MVACGVCAATAASRLRKQYPSLFIIFEEHIIVIFEEHIIHNIIPKLSQTKNIRRSRSGARSL
jgi:hypothetical protein